MSRTAKCDRCDRQLWVDDVHEPWLTCPRCLNAVHNPWYDGGAAVTTEPRPSPRTAGFSLERDVRRDRTGSVIGLCVVGVLLVVGVVVFIATGGPQLVAASPEGPAVFGITLLILAAIVIGVGCLIYFSRDATAKIIGGTLGGVAAGAVVVLGFVLLVIFAICAGISDFLNTCNKGVGH